MIICRSWRIILRHLCRIDIVRWRQVAVTRSLIAGVAGTSAVVVAAAVVALAFDESPAWIFWLVHAPALPFVKLLDLLPEGAVVALVNALSPRDGGSAFQISIFYLTVALAGWFVIFGLGHWLWVQFKRRHHAVTGQGDR
jgi:hypothetical protein